MENLFNLINTMGITIEENIVDNDDFETCVELQPISELLNALVKGDVIDGEN